MITWRPGEERGHFDFGWLDTRHSFSFGEYVDPAHERFRTLRVLNEDRVLPGKGFGTHGHRDMEILTWVLEGALEHHDSLGTHGVIRPGEVQVMSAGTGIRHSEFNASKSEPVHFLQIWILPERTGLPPRYDQIALREEDLRNRWAVIAGREAGPGRVRIFQDVQVSVARLDAGRVLDAAIPEGRGVYLQVVRGTVSSQGRLLQAGDGARLQQEPSFTLKAESDAEILAFDLA